jgi:pimeloyl-ACP methyl ester carboxylesterase
MMAGAAPTRLPIVILGGAFSWPGLYAGMRRALGECAGAPVSVVPANPIDWALAVSAYGWHRILRKLDLEVRRVAIETGGLRVVLIGHSSGGVIGRLYLSPEPFRGTSFSGLERVGHLITLGSPNTNQRVGPMRRWVDRQYPGAHFAPAVQYTSVAGKRREGRERGTAAERATYAVYRKLRGAGATWGDGLVPVDVALLPGATPVVLDGVGHGPMLGRPWYGTADVVRRWWAAASEERA